MRWSLENIYPGGSGSEAFAAELEGFERDIEAFERSLRDADGCGR